jgi:isopenicillin N synthase-like dioxygenase
VIAASMNDRPTIPIISIAPLLSGGDEGLRSVATAIQRAATEVGSFYIADHGIDAALVAATHAIARRFFALPLADKPEDFFADKFRKPLARGSIIY